MARTKGLVSQSIYDVSQRKPLDARMLVTKRVDLITPDIWIPTDMDRQMSYNGMITAVNGDGEYNGIYYLADRTLITEENYNAYLSALAAGEDVEAYFSMWNKLAELSQFADLAARVADLENAAESGKVDLTPIKNDVSTLMTSVANMEEVTVATSTDLPTVGKECIVYIIVDEDKRYLWSNSMVCYYEYIPEYKEIQVIHGGSSIDFNLQQGM